MPLPPSQPSPPTSLTELTSKLLDSVPSSAPAFRPRRTRGVQRTPVHHSTGPRPPTPQILLNPCSGCPRAKAIKVKPIIPKDPVLIVVGLAPGEIEEERGEPFQGPAGQEVRDALTTAGFDLEQVGFANLARCRPDNDDFTTKEWQEAERRCYSYLSRDLAQAPNAPLLLLGTRPLASLTGDSKLLVTAMRGLWVTTTTGRLAYSARHPASILRTRDSTLKLRLAKQWVEDIARFGARLNGKEKPRDIEMTIFKTPQEATQLLRRLAKHTHPWVFDIETYDARETPSRKFVSTDPCHPDFRVRGVSFAWAPNKGAWIELMGVEGQQAEVKKLLDPVFMSSAVKGAFNGGFDEEGLTYSDWVTEIVNRRWDGMLALVALSDGRQSSLRLERAVVDLLGYPQYWNGVDKGRVRDLPLEEVARAAIEDACSTWALCSLADKRLAKAEYIVW
jgi:uracil-DNA glycosylase family 4